MFPGDVADIYLDHSTGHGAFAPDSLNAHEMNVKPGGNQRRMHSTRIPMDNPNPALRGLPQEMNFPENLPPSHPHYQFRGQPKGMRVVLEERGLLDWMSAKNGGKRPIGTCENCRMSQKARDKKAREEAAAKIGEDDNDDQWEDIDADHDDRDPECDVDPINDSPHCCMQRVLSRQKDFCSEKPMIQIFIEEAGHRCFFLPKFHCEFNPIEMYWGWVKRRE